jgi:hypothetical protein
LLPGIKNEGVAALDGFFSQMDGFGGNAPVLEDIDHRLEQQCGSAVAAGLFPL